ncbi:CheR family methyltransferase [Natronoflexus pectinivorans]|uniref:Chemotaxis protein methyltransferase CheR n=1 Tax=Natronoflexus pectinivorans TaxID=682526 RepID=A0A4R2GNP1_9BACT|nr:CheR family methyltransferase [Natronoflexus pectinivorans]TCO10944.1 chemotaxis protein methyltransferase CheR [Natronoflexus pectinivorans]
MNLGINDIREITSAMSAYTNMDYTEYALSFLKRRLAYIFDQFNIRKVGTFIEALSKNDFREHVIKLMFVENSEMFRDPAFWRSLRDNVLLNLPEGTQNIWVPDEPSGEEIFSLAIILHEMNQAGKYNILCSNPSTSICASIREGRINASHLDVSQTNYKRLENRDRFNEYIKKENGTVLLTENITSQVNCEEFDIIKNNKPDKTGLIIFRNKAIYYNTKKAEKTLTELYNNLLPGGYIAIGVKEKMPLSINDELIVVDKSEKIYQKPQLKRNSHHA